MSNQIRSCLMPSSLPMMPGSMNTVGRGVASRTSMARAISTTLGSKSSNPALSPRAIAATMRAGAVRVAKIVEMVDGRPFKETPFALLSALGTAVHRRGVDDQVMATVVEAIRHPDQELCPPCVRVEVAGDHVQLARDDRCRPVHKLDERRLRHHRLDAGQGLRIRALLDDRRDEITDVAGDLSDR